MKFEPQCKKQSDLHREWARVLDMCEAAGFDRIGECTKFDGFVGRESWSLALSPERYEFAIAIVEGKPVFRGDEIFNGKGIKFVVYDVDDYGPIGKSSDGTRIPNLMSECTWNPPKPATITINGMEVKAPEEFNQNEKYCFGNELVLKFASEEDALAMKAALEGKK